MLHCVAFVCIRFIVSGQIPRVDYWTHLDHFVFLCLMSQIMTLVAAQAAMHMHTIPVVGPYINTLCFVVQMVAAGVSLEWLTTRLYNHFIDIQTWIESAEKENQCNKAAAEAYLAAAKSTSQSKTPVKSSGLKSLSGKEISMSTLVSLSTSDDFLGNAGHSAPPKKTRPAPANRKRLSLFAFLTSDGEHAAAGGFTEFGTGSGRAAALNQTKFEDKQKAIIKKHTESGKVCLR